MAIDVFQALLRELFQFDCADLDFGIYRIMNYKRGVIEKFITKDLPQAVTEELDRGALADQSQANKEVKELEQQIRGIDAHAIDADGVFVNGDSFIPNAKALDPVFKARMFAPLEA
jgi:adenine-specific DNA-methyltransferase